MKLTLLNEEIQTILGKNLLKETTENEEQYEQLAMDISFEQPGAVLIERLFVFNQNNQLPLTKQIKEAFKELTIPKYPIKSAKEWIVLPPYYNAPTKILAIFLDLYCKAYFSKLEEYAKNIEVLQNELTNFNYNLRETFRELLKCNPQLRHDLFVVHVIKLSLLNLYLQIERAYPNVKSLYKFTLEEVLYKIDSNYHNNKTIQNSLAYTIKNYLLDLEELDAVAHSAEQHKANDYLRFDREACRFCPTRSSLLIKEPCTSNSKTEPIAKTINNLDDSEVINQRMATKLLNVSDNTLLALTKTHKIQKMRLGRSNYYVKAEIDSLKMNRKKLIQSA